jgi:gliding motility-associated-like protein
MFMNKRLPSALIMILLIFQIGSLAQGVRLRCTEVMQNGDALLGWNPITLGTGFYNYTVYYSPVRSSPNYAELSIITDISISSYLHAGAGADLNPGYYYLIVNKNTGSYSTDTLSTMVLSATTSDYEIVNFNWTPLHQPLLSTMNPWYLLYREYPPGNWEAVDSVQDPSLSFSYHFWDCNFADDTVRFQVRVHDNQTGCYSISSLQGAVLKNLSNRFPPVIDSVSIDENGKVIIGWEPGSEPDINGYDIYYVTSGVPSTNDSIDHVNGRFSTSYLNQSSDPCSGPLRYIISSVDSCGNESPFPFYFDTLTSTNINKPHSTIFLSDVNYNPCQMANTLQWNEYINFEPPLAGYRIFVSENNSPFILLTTVSPGQTAYTHTGLQPNTSYEYYVRAFNQGGLKTSTSCRKEVATYNSPIPAFMYTRFVTVENNEHVNIVFYTDTLAHVKFYRILRSTSPSGPFTEITTANDQGREFVALSDSTANVNEESYYYQVGYVDSCGTEGVIANIARTIYLQCEALPDRTNHLTWNKYESWYGQVLGYRIYRRLDNSALTELASVDSLTQEYTDNVSNLTGSVSRISYIVEAFEGLSNPLGFREQSYSNEVLSEQEPKVYLPNAIMPNGINNQLKPVLVFVGSEGYDFIIYDRWGQQIFRTSNPDDAWNGTFNGNYVPEGVYVYLLRFRNALNQPRQIKGNVAVIY